MIIDAFGVMVFGCVIAGVFLVATRVLDVTKVAKKDERVGSDAYKLTRRMAHALEGVLLQDEMMPSLREADRESIKKLLREWEEMI